ncbi:glycosyltransferase family 4 protein [Vibrio cyclitrophicus]|uniref:glycosyltransferase family 4 protein n=1 Tax=Vibrio cyclitrophicus TaxID=47951 RepID=UPI000C8584CC|nr:glycosyltransferase family 4 protein [Vibrio cyclitrophicus]PMK96685.1 hypothetical protein BCT87_09325 [Vibrio cyclitrophicus]
MKIAVLSSRYPCSKNPYNHMFIHTRNKQYIEKGHEVIVLVPSLNSEVYEIDGVTVIKGDVYSLKRELENIDGVMIHLLFHRFTKKTDAGELYNYILDYEIPTLFFIHGVECQKIWKSRRSDINLLKPASIARFFYRDFYLIDKMKKTLDRFMKSHSKVAFVTPSKWMMNESNSSTNIDITSKTKVIANGIDTKKFSYENNYALKDKFLSIRPLYKDGKYAVDILLDTAKKIQSNPKLSVSLYGDGPDRLIIQDKANELSNVSVYPRFLKVDQIKEVHSQHGVYLGVTRMDAQGVSMCEAMASGLPVISFDTCAIPEFVKHGETGLLAPEFSVEAYSDLISELNESKVLYDRLSENGRIFCEEIDITKTTEEELNILNFLR